MPDLSRGGTEKPFDLVMLQRATIPHIVRVISDAMPPIGAGIQQPGTDDSHREVRNGSDQFPFRAFKRS